MINYQLISLSFFNHFGIGIKIQYLTKCIVKKRNILKIENFFYKIDIKLLTNHRAKNIFYLVISIDIDTIKRAPNLTVEVVNHLFRVCIDKN